jgi:hypothetical protein
MKPASGEAGSSHDGDRHSDGRLRGDASDVYEDRERHDRAAAAERTEGYTDQERQQQCNCLTGHYLSGFAF